MLSEGLCCIYSDHLHLHSPPDSILRLPEACSAEELACSNDADCQACKADFYDTDDDGTMIMISRPARASTTQSAQSTAPLPSAQATWRSKHSSVSMYGGPCRCKAYCYYCRWRFSLGHASWRAPSDGTIQDGLSPLCCLMVFAFEISSVGQLGKLPRCSVMGIPVPTAKLVDRRPFANY